ncbi:hypothetical protein [uncultured Sunxiuqinia sp.]|uniref:hypothetical protein n=1 Tax=uncultured Sunxiuqinia sp. TaxID=1573825 RepID=UPI00262D5685|nr:hypothetical protein [uncultured Sunxiuqinia sp.]
MMNQAPNNTPKRLTRWILAFFIGLVIIGGTLLFLWADKLIQKELNAWLKAKTANQYVLHFEDLSVNLFTRSIRIQEIEIKKKSASQTADFLQAEAISVKRINLYKLLTKNELHIRELEINSPVWTLKTDSTKSKSSYAFVKELRSVFGQDLQSLAIDKISLTNAGFIDNQLSNQLQPKSLGALNLNIGISNFYTDSSLIRQKDDFFRADDVFLSLDNYRKALSDSIHELSIQNIQYSLKSNDIIGRSIELSPTRQQPTSRTQYLVTIPEISIKSNQFNKLFQQDSIHIDSLFLHQADIKVIPVENAPEMNFRQMKEFDLYQLAEGEFTQLSINHLSMNARKLQIDRKSEDKASMQEFYDLNVQLDKFVLNDQSFNDPDRILYAKDFYLQLDNYYLLMNDQVHRFDATNIIASTQTNSIQADQLQLKPNQNPSTTLTRVDMECDSIRFRDIDLKRLFHKREMPLQSILAYSPKVLINQGQKKQKASRETNSLLYYFIRNYIKGVYASVVDFDEGRVVVLSDEGSQQSGEISSNFDFKLTDFSLDSISAERTDKLFFATNIELTFSDYNMKLVDQIHRLQIDQIDVSSYNNRASLTNFRLSPDDPKKNARLLKKFNRSQIYEITIPHLILSNTNIHQAFFRKKLQINNFSIIEPSISLEVFSRPNKEAKRNSPQELYELLNNYIENISIGKIEVPNGNIQLVTHSRKGKTSSFNNKFSVELENFLLNAAEIEKSRLFFADDFELKIEDQLFQLSDNVHNLQASEIGISSKKSQIYIRNAILYPDITSKIYGDLPMHFHINIPEIKLQGVDLEEAYFEQQLDVDRFLINQPEINLYRSEVPQKQVDFKDAVVPLPKEMQRLTITQFKLTGGKINIFKTNELQESKILTSNLQMIGDNNSLISHTANTPAAFKSDNISTSLSQVIFKPEKGNVDYTADSVHFSTRKRDLTLRNLLLTNNAATAGKGFVELKVPGLTFKEVDIQQVLNKKNLHFESIQAERPQLTIQKSDNSNSRVNLFQLKIPSDISPLFSEIAAHQIHLTDGELISRVGNTTKHFPNLQVELQEFKLDTIPAEHLLGAQSVKLNLKNYAFSDKANLYNFNLGDIQFNNQNNQLSIEDIQITPRYSKQQFQTVIPFETDHYQGSINRLDLINLDLKRWYQQGELTASQLIADGGTLNIYRDKRTADDPNKQSKMPQEILKDMALPIYFDTLKLTNYDLYYEEQAPERPFPGLVYFRDMTIRAFPVTNLPYLANAKTALNVKASAWLMGESLMEVSMKYDLRSPVNQFQVSGHLSPFDLTYLNPVTRNAAGIAVRSGQLDRFEFDFIADQELAQGKLKFAYDNLRIAILEQKDGDTKEAKFLSFLTNSLVLKSKHPRTRILLPDDIYFKRNPQKSVVNYWWKSIFSGAKNTFGIKEEKEE